MIGTSTQQPKKLKDPNKHFKIKFFCERPTIEGKMPVELSLNSTMNQESWWLCHTLASPVCCKCLPWDSPSPHRGTPYNMVSASLAQLSFLGCI